MILLEISKGPRAWQLCAAAPYDEAATIQFQAMPGLQWNRSRKAWCGEKAAIWIVASILEAAGIAQVEDFSSEPVALGRVGLAALPPDLKGFQIEGVSRLVGLLELSGAALLADEMGVGKTPQAIVTADQVALGAPVLVVSDASVIPHWERSFKRWSLRPERFRVTSYARLQAIAKGGNTTNAPLDPSTGFFVFDEAHHLTNPKAKRTAAAKALISMVRPTGSRPFILALTGTPIPARVKQLWAILDLLWPRRFGTKFQFEKRYAGGHHEEIPGVEWPVWVAEGATRLEELRERMAALMVRRTKSEVALELPAKTREIVEVKIPAKNRKDLQAALDAIAISGRTVGISSLLSDVEEFKIDEAEKIAEEIMASGGAPLLLTTRRATALELGRRLNCPVVTGDVPPQDRERILSGLPVAVSTIYSVQTGISLVDFDAVIFVGLDWLPSTLLQAEDRAHRIGQNRNVRIFYLVGAGTVDEVVRERVLDRLEIFGKIVGDGSDGLRSDLAGPTEAELLGALVARMKKGARK